MINRIWYDGNIDNDYKLLPIKQIYAWVYVKSKKKIVIVSKDGVNRQMPGGKPEKGESVFETLHREIYEETSINIDKNHNPEPFGYYYIGENGAKYLQLRYFIEIEDIDEKDLKPSEKCSNDSINYVKLADINEIIKIIPRLSNSGELNGFIKVLKQGIKIETLKKC